MHDSFSHSRQRKYSLHQPPLRLTTETESVWLCLYCTFVLNHKWTPEVNLQSILTYFNLVLVHHFQAKFHQKIDSQKATSTSQLVKSCSCEKHPVFGTSTEVRKGQLTQTTQMMAWLQVIMYLRRQSSYYRQLMPQQ